MLRFNYFRSPDGERWVLSGQLSRPWIDTLRSIWQCFRYRAPRGRVVVGLKEVSAVDTLGAELLADLRKAGVVVTEHAIDRNRVSKGEDIGPPRRG